MGLRGLRNLSFAVFCSVYVAFGGATSAATTTEGSCTYRCGSCYVTMTGCDWCEAGGEHGECTSSGIGCSMVCWNCGSGQECFDLGAEGRP